MVEFTSHPNYPMLLPGSIARVWKVVGGHPLLVPQAVAFIFTFGAIGLLTSLVAVLKNISVAMLSALVVLANPRFIEIGAAQYADIPLAFFLLASAGILAYCDRRRPGDAGLMALAGILAGFAAWTKNEGMLLCIVLLAVRARRSFKDLAIFAAGMAPILLLVFIFKHRYATPNEFLQAQPASTIWLHLKDSGRYATLLRWLGKYAVNFPGMPFGSPFALVLAFLGCAGMAAQRDRAGAATISAILGLQFAGYCVILVSNPYPIDWELWTTLDRLLLHLWPAAVLAAFLAAVDPVSVLAKPSLRPSLPPVLDPSVPCS